MMSQSITEAVAAKAHAILDGVASCHDWDHTLRVRRHALELASQLPGADVCVVEVSALLHDIGRPAEVRANGKLCHAQLGAEMAYGILKELGVSDEAFITHVCACIRTHRYRRRTPDQAPDSLEAKIVYDADKLDSLGAVGLARSFHFASKLDARIHNTADEALASESYTREDTAYREYLVKLRYLPESMLTLPGQTQARKLLAFMEEFFDELNRETMLT